MDDNQTITEEALSAEEEARHRRRMTGMLVFLAIFAVPVLIGSYLVLKVRRQLAEERAWAEAELGKPSPDPRAYASLGAALLQEGRPAEALPLLQKASEIEKKDGGSVGALILLIEAHLDGLKRGAAGASRLEALDLLAQLRDRASRLPQGRAAAAFHAAGKLYGHLGERRQAVECLQKAVDLQPDDWVDEGGGVRYKRRGIASVYAKDLASALNP